MISLLRVAGLDELLEETIKGYAAIVGFVRDHCLRACPPVASHYAASLEHLRTQLGPGVTREQLRAIRQNLEKQIRQFGDHAFREFHSREEELRELARLVAKATELLVTRTGQASSEWTSLANQLETLALTNDLDLLRQKLRAHVAEIRQSIERMALQDSTVIQELQSELAALRQRLEVAQRSASFDPLTHLPNHQELERQFESWRSAHKPFSLVAFDINRLKAINDRYSPAGGDHVLREFAHRLRSALRYTDFACRLENDEFAVLMDGPFRDAIVRSGQLADKLCGRYTLRVGGEEIRVDVSAAVGLAEYRSGQTLHQVIQRARTAIAAQKQASP
ncbi:MAG: diguanylate cyclase [Bryobacteraceae bacterium]|nr:diguanylate cyclase [Bryobacteraceae bacterium]MDW8380169.1 diguanylate cyclase [Bryobacterales bacterium]